MANREHLDRLKEGIEAWNTWRRQFPNIRPDLRDANLRGANLRDAYLRDANLSRAYLREADLSRAYLREADLSYANLRRADLSRAYLWRADLSYANLRGAYLWGADLGRAMLIETDFTDAILSNCHIYGISAWDVELQGASQNDLIITPDGEAIITVDTLEVAQFVYLLLNNAKIRDVISTLTTKAVLILGRFTPERKAVLDSIREELRKHNYLPILFDFEKPESRDLTETVSILAHLARFIIVDLTDPSSVPHEVATIIPQTVVPVQPLLTLQPLIIDGKAVVRHEYAMFEDLRKRYSWVLPTFRYQDTAELLASLQEHIIDPAEQKVQELERR